MELWNYVCKTVRSYQGKNIPESKIEELWMTVFMELGWSKIKGELIAQIEVPIGANNKLIPDILLRINNENVLVVELKRANQEFRDKHSNQLISYMLQMRVDVGILIGNKLQIYYDNPTNKNNPQNLFSIDFIENNLVGIKLFELLIRSDFTQESLHKYCNELLEEHDNIEKAKIIADNLASNNEIINDFKELLKNKYGQSIAKHLLDYINIEIFKKNSYKEDRHVKTGKVVPPNVQDEKIGAKAKRLFGSYIANENFSLIEISSLSDAKYSKLNFGAGYPILKEIKDGDSESIRFDRYGRARYWKEVFQGYGRQFYITSQWYETQSSYLESYFNRLNIRSETNSEKFEFNLDGVTYRIILEQDDMSKYPHLVNLHTGYIAKNQKNICREYLKPYGFNVPMDADVFLTHDSIKLVYKVLNNLPLTQKEISIKFL